MRTLTLWRHRGNLVAESGSVIQPMQKVLTEMNVPGQPRKFRRLPLNVR